MAADPHFPARLSASQPGGTLTTPFAQRATAALQGRYEIQGELGSGGMATVFLARDPRYDREVALKVLHPDLGATLGSERFLREVRITAQLSHPHVLPLLDSGESDGLLWYVMPYVRGETLRARIDRAGALPVTEAVQIAREVADALAYAHGRGIVHRDVKPENILLDSGHALVADFGIARALGAGEPGGDRVTATGIAIGTPLYMSPEQLDGTREADPRSDVYALGCVLWEMLAGEPAFGGPTARSLAKRVMGPPPSVREARPSVTHELDAAVARAMAATPADRYQTAEELASALVAGAGAAPPRAATPRRTGVTATALLGTAAVLGALAWLALRPGRPATGVEETPSIAVLPFVNLSADTADQYLADGLTDELITSLSFVEGLRVASRTSSFAYRDLGLDVREIGRRLGVSSVLEGSVRHGSGGIRVSATLVSVEDGYQRWSRPFDSEVKDPLLIQEEIARAIVATVQGDMGDQEAATRGGTTSPEAYDLYLRARFFRNKRTEDGLRRAVELFNEAVAISPGYARAYAGLGESYAVIGFYDLEPPRQAFPAAARAAHEALRLDPGLGSAHATLGYVALYHDWEWVQAEDDFLRAIEREPSYATAHQWYANFLTARGRFDEAEREMREAIALDPLLMIANAALGWVLYYAGDEERALGQLRATLELDGTFALTHLWAGQALEVLGRLDEAEVSLRRGAELSGNASIYMAALARLLALRGERTEAEQLLGQVLRASPVPAFEVAKVHDALGSPEEAMRWLERAYDERSHSMVFLRVDPQLAGLRSLSAFEELARRVGL